MLRRLPASISWLNIYSFCDILASRLSSLYLIYVTEKILPTNSINVRMNSYILFRTVPRVCEIPPNPVSIFCT